MKVWLDGRIVDGAEAKVSVLDHGFLYGDGVFEGMRVYSGRLFRLERHLDRLEAGARCLGLALPGGRAGLAALTLATAREHLRASDESDAYVRLVVSRGVGELGVDPTSCPEPFVTCIVDKIRIFSDEKLRSGITLITSSRRSPPPDVRDPRVKSLNYLNNALAKQEARRHGADDALLLNQAGAVAEASVANVFAVRGGRLLTPPASDGALEGITRASVLEIAAQLGVPAEERTLGRYDLIAADEAFLTGSGAKVVPVASLDGARIGRGEAGPLTQKLIAAFDRYARDPENGTPL
ncbi:MAG TPA: branched-chain-amino-acid transaminase [Myxococcota bacterium]|nr:branched-chain-amino-acid transaminase [Myxococcota bacterium]